MVEVVSIESCCRGRSYDAATAMCRSACQVSSYLERYHRRCSVARRMRSVTLRYLGKRPPDADAISAPWKIMSPSS